MKERPLIIVGNWKMNKTIEEAVSFVHSLSSKIVSDLVKIYLAVPYTAIRSVAEAAKKTSFMIGAQNMNEEVVGAFTGEVAATQLKEAGACFVILGHSERRHLFHEDNTLINKKVLRALSCGLTPLLCVGETEHERKSGNHFTIIQEQIQKGLLNVPQGSSLLLAYEPLWAIGTGQHATPSIAEEMLAFCRSCLNKLSLSAPILYGGSVRPDNTKELIEQPDADGLLVGGASLVVSSFTEIIETSLTVRTL